MSTLPSASALLLLIDLQQGFSSPCWSHWGGNRNNPEMEDNISTLLATWRGRGSPVWHVHHSSLEKRSPLHESHEGFACMPRLGPITVDGKEEPVYVKHVNSAFIGTTLEEDLRKNGITEVVLCGLTTHHCVSTSTRMAANLGFSCWVAGDGCAVFDRAAATGPTAVFPADVVHDVNLASLHGEFARVVKTTEIS